MAATFRPIWIRIALFWIIRIFYFGALSVPSMAAITRRNADADMQYSVMIDAGSSGSRVRVYSWESGSGLPDFEEIYNYKVKPGISVFKESTLDGVASYLRELLVVAENHVPQEQWDGTPIYVMATAGMRLLMEPRASAIMEEIQNVLADPDYNSFQYSELHVRILSGEEEGVFAWIAANYLNNFFKDPAGGESVGILEMGGASTQIAFIPDGDILADKFPVRVGSHTYPLYVHSYLHYGQEYTDVWVKDFLYRTAPQDTLVDPCMLEGDTQIRNISNTMVTYQGSSDPQQCMRVLSNLVYKVPPIRCHPKPCAIGSFYQPSIPETKMFYALAAFYFPLERLGITHPNSLDTTFTPEDTYAAAVTYCSKNLTTVMEETGDDPDFLSIDCLMGVYIPLLLSEGYGFANDSRQVSARQEINGNAPEWTLGGMIYEHERAAALRCLSNPKRPASVPTSGTSPLPTYTVTLCLIALLLVYNTRDAEPL